MKKLLFALFLLSLLVSCKRKEAESTTGSAGELTIQFHCHNLSEDENDPRYAVYASVGDSKIKIAETPVCDLLEKDQWAAIQIPEDAIAAAGGWWAGSGDYFYAREAGEKILFFQGWADEMQSDSLLPYQLVASFNDGRFRFERPTTGAQLTGTYIAGGPEQSYILFFGLKDTSLEGQLFQIAGNLPDTKDLTKIMMMNEPLPLNNLEFRLEDLSFGSDIVQGYFLNQPEGMTVILPEYQGKKLTLKRVETEKEL